MHVFVYVYIHTHPSEPPSSPRKLTVSDITNESVKLHWKPPKSDNKAPVSAYIIETCKGPGEDFIKFCEVTERECVISGLSPDTGYQFAVTGLNESGSGKRLVLDGIICTKPEFSEWLSSVF
jgi:hypothetical protein